MIAALCFPIAHAAESEWIKLQAPRFGVVSQLDEEGTRKWAVEFEQFVDALQQLYSIDDVDLPPLTIVLFDNARDFAPYRPRTESGQTDADGFFGRMEGWSVIGLAGRVRSSETRRIIYHEAVHWFASGDAVQAPLWFREGLAEVYSTSEVEDGKGVWGQAIEPSLEYLRAFGVEPLDEFLRRSQDEALHRSPTYYPQAWAFLHYLLFGDGGAHRADLARLAVAGNNDDLARRHIDAVIALAPSAPEPFELRAIVAQRANDAAAFREALDAALERGSEDPFVLEAEAFYLIDANSRDGVAVEELLPPEIAREAADPDVGPAARREARRILYRVTE